MLKIKNKALKIAKSDYFPFFVLAFLLLFFHACIKVGWNDDEYYSKVLIDNNIFDWLKIRYNTWSSRIVIEFFLLLVSSKRILWRLINVAIMVLGAISISKIFPYKKLKDINWVICALILCIPTNLYNSAGWIATTSNYSWTLFLGLFSLLPIKKIIYKEKISWYEYILYFATMIYAINQEQMCVISLMTFLVFTVYTFLKNKKINIYLLICSIFNLISLIFILSCPGNANRKIIEINVHFPEYQNINFFRKIEMGYSSLLFEFIMKPNFIFLIFTLLIFVCMRALKKNKVLRLVSLIPIGSIIIFGFLADLIGKHFNGITAIKNSMTQYGTGITLFSPRTWIPDIILTLVCLSTLFSLYVIFENKKTYLLTLFILTLGFISRMIMSFSPTIWASGDRTFIFMYASLLICSIILYREFCNKVNDKFILESIVFILSMMSFFNMVY